MSQTTTKDVGESNKEQLDCDRSSTAEQMARCTEKSRHRVEQTLKQVEARISPNQLIDDAIDYFRQVIRGEDRPSGLERSVARNPLPFAAIGIGLSLLGAGVASYSFAKMRGASASTGPGTGADDVEGDPDDVPRTEVTVETVREPQPAAAVFDTRRSEQASTESVQAGIHRSRAQDDSILQADDAK